MKAGKGTTTEERKPIRLYSTKQAARLWGISYWRLRDLVLDGTIRPITNMGKGWMFDGLELNEEVFERL
jgi:hypothetical protein